MADAGLDVPSASPKEVAHWTTQTMLRGVPAAVPGIHFLSGGMSEEEATINLQALQVLNSPYLNLDIANGQCWMYSVTSLH